LKVKEQFIILFSLAVFLILYLYSDLNVSESFILGLQVYTLFRFINNIGYTVCFFDFLSFFSVFSTLTLSILGYRVFNQQNPIAYIYRWYMRVPESIYYAYMIPVNLALLVGVNILQFRIKEYHYKELFNRLFKSGKNKGKLGIVLSLIGFVSSFFLGSESQIGFFIYLLAMLKYVGPLYVYISDLPFRKSIFISSIVLFFLQALLQGMFGEFIMYIALTFIVLALGFKPDFFIKLLFFTIVIFLTLALQDVKPVFRQIAWKGKSVEGLTVTNNSRFEIFSTLFINRFYNPELMLDNKSEFLIYSRLNQGVLISRVMNYVPRVEPYANGETLIRTLGGIIVPRFLWPDKPEAGGYENLSRFLGIKKRLGYSMNIGPYGEAYGNFGPFYGIVFTFFYGLVLSLIFKVYIYKCFETPTLLLWAPLLFSYTLTVETDIFGTLNFVIKAALFVFALYWLSKKLFNTDL
jgi:hypothetical protein